MPSSPAPTESACLTPERLDRAALRARQQVGWERLIDTVLPSNRFWQQKLAGLPLSSAELRSVDCLAQFPFTTKQELVEDQNRHPPFGSNLTWPRTAYSRLHQTSGTTGKPMRWLDSPGTWDWFMSCWGQIYRLVGVRPDDILAFPFSFGPFIGFWAGFEGACRHGNLALAMGGMTSEARLALILELGATFLCCTPTYAMRLIEVAEELRLDIASSAVRGIIVAGEPGGCLPAVRARLESAWNARVFDHWGMTDIGSLGIEPLQAPGGLSLLETECIAEIIHPETLQPQTPGELGELVMTNLGRLGQPVIRYRTGDLVRAATTPCPAGLSLLRLEGGILGRADDMVTIRGNNVFPSSIEAILRELPEVVEYRIIVQTKRSMTHLKLQIEAAESVQHSRAAVDQLLHRISRTIKDRLNFQAEIEPVSCGALPRFELKGKRLIREDRPAR